MIEILFQKEAAYKLAAEAATKAGDWASLRDVAERLVAVYEAILESGLVDRSTHPRWDGLRARWCGISAQAAERSALAAAAKTSAASSTPASEARVPQHEGVVDAIPTAPPPARAAAQTAAGAGKLCLADVQGLEEAKRIVMKALINPVRHPDVYKTLGIRSGKGLLLYGPPGTGKTLFARAIAGEMNLPFIYRKASELKDKYVGESEKNVARLCEEAYRHKRCIVFLDECDELLRKRGNQKVNILGAFLEEMDGFSTNRDSQVFFLLASNRPWLIDSAMMSRVGAAAHVGLPDAQTRRAILAAALKNTPLADDVDLDALAQRTEGYSGRQIAGEGIGICYVAATNAAERWIARREMPCLAQLERDRVEPIAIKDFEAAMQSIIPVSVSDPEIVTKNEAFSLSGKPTHHGMGDEESED